LILTIPLPFLTLFLFFQISTEYGLLADRGFVHTRLMRACTEKWGWHYRIRVKSNCWIWRGKQGWCQLKDFHLNRGEATWGLLKKSKTKEI
jgi:hypothetical protein